jgi:putative transposase
MSDYVVSDRFWEQAKPLLEPFQRRKSGGSKPLDCRRVMNGILYVLKSGCQWALLPPGDGPTSAVHEHLQRWVTGGVFTALFRLGAEERCGCAWTWQSLDGRRVPAPVCQARRQAETGLGRNPTDRGRSGSKFHLPVDQNGLPVAVVAAGGQCPRQPTCRPDGAGGRDPRRPRRRPVPCTCACIRAMTTRASSWKSSVWATQPNIRRIGEEKSVGAGATEETHPARRWVAERTFAWLQGFRAIRTRYTDRGCHYLALVLMTTYQRALVI